MSAAPITPLQRRWFIVLDEWLGIGALIYLDASESRLFWPMLIAWAVAIYGISYPWHWWLQSRESRDREDLTRVRPPVTPE